jgi:uncharacterized LabA/DUF88 family protein
VEEDWQSTAWALREYFHASVLLLVLLAQSRSVIMLRVALLVDGWNILKSADRIKRRVNFGQLPHVVAGANRNREIIFQRFYIGPVTGRNAAQRVGRIADEVRAFGYEWIQCATEGAHSKTTVDTYLAMDILTWAYCHSVDVIALCSGDGGYAEAIRRAKVLGLRVEVYAIRSGNHLSATLERNAHSIHDLEASGILQQGNEDSLDDLCGGHLADD